MPTSVAERPKTGPPTSYNGFLKLCGLVGFKPEPFQRRIVRMVLEAEREALILLPRGNGNTRLGGGGRLRPTC
jgi:hypothetical protein